MNSRLWLKALFIAAVMAWISCAALGQRPGKTTGPKYDTANEVKIKGVIVEVREVPGEFEGLYLVVKTETKTVLVHVAPSEFLKEIDTSFNKGDQVEVVGAKAPDAPDEEILAREIIDGTNTATLRDDKGIPIWAGWKPSKPTGK
ncbi:MAG: hypothetical protein ABSC64_17790 [Candidatus Korobacteraceae bacterium]|jgi:hypothetical protein